MCGIYCFCVFFSLEFLYGIYFAQFMNHDDMILALMNDVDDDNYKSSGFDDHYYDVRPLGLYKRTCFFAL